MIYLLAYRTVARTDTRQDHDYSLPANFTSQTQQQYKFNIQGGPKNKPRNFVHIFAKY